MWVPVAVWQPCELLYACYLLTQQAIWCLYNRLGRLEYYQGSHAAWNFPCEISSTSQVLANEFGPEKSWNLPGNDADADAKTRVRTPLFCVRRVPLLFLHNMWQWWTDTPVWMLLSFCIYVVSNCCLSLYLNIASLRQGPGKVREFFCNQDGTPYNMSILIDWWLCTYTYNTKTKNISSNVASIEN